LIWIKHEGARALMIRYYFRRSAQADPDHALCRAPQIFRQRAIGQRFCQMQPSDLFRAVEVGQRARDAKHAMIAARGQLHGFGGVAQQLLALEVTLAMLAIVKNHAGRALLILIVSCILIFDTERVLDALIELGTLAAALSSP
jgi:hypothetical protein